MRIVDIKNGDGLRRFLKLRPHAISCRAAVQLSLRNALRVMPLVTYPQLSKSNYTHLPHLTYFCFKFVISARLCDLTDVSLYKNVLSADCRDAYEIDCAEVKLTGRIGAARNDAIHVATNAWHATNFAASHAADSAAFISDNGSVARSGAIDCAVLAAVLAAAAADVCSGIAITDPDSNGGFSFSLWTPDSAAFSEAVWQAISVDCAVIEASGPRALLSTPLWPESAPRPVGFAVPEILRLELRAVPNGHVWLRWYDRMLSGHIVSDKEEMLYTHEDILPLWEKKGGSVKVAEWLAEELVYLDKHTLRPSWRTWLQKKMGKRLS